MNESMRLRGNGGVWRKTLREVELGGYLLPTGSLVGTAMGLFNHAPELYPHPERYDPERYLTMKTDDFQSPSVSARECQFGVFGAGRHLCPGRGLAYLLVGSALTLMLREFRFALVKKPWLWFELLTAGIPRPVGPLRVQVAARS